MSDLSLGSKPVSLRGRVKSVVGFVALVGLVSTVLSSVYVAPAAAVYRSEVVLISGSNPVSVPETLVFEIELENTDNFFTGNNVTIREVTLPDGSPGTLSGPVETFTSDGVFEQDEIWKYTISYNVTAADIAAGDDLLMFTKFAIDFGPTRRIQNAQMIVTIPPPVPEVAVIQTEAFNDENGNGFAEPGETISYGFDINNTGNTGLTNVTVTDSLGGLVVSGSPIASLAEGVIDSSSYTAVHVLSQADVDQGFFFSQVDVSSDEGASDVSGTSFTNDFNVLTTLTALDEVALIKTGSFVDESGDGKAQVGETITYAFAVENTGGGTLHSVAVSDTLGGLVLSGSPISSLASGVIDSTTYVGTHTITQADIDSTTKLNRATVSTSEGVSDISGPDNASDVDTVVFIPATSSADFVKTGTFQDESGDGFAQVGETVDYTFSVENTGDTTLTSVTVSDLVGGVTVSGSPFIIAPGVTDDTTYSGTYTITQADVDAGQFFNSANLNFTGAGVFGIETASFTTTLPTIQEVSLIKTGTFVDESGEGFATTDETIDYTFTVENTGDTTLTNVTVIDPTTGVVLSGAPIGSLAPGAIDSSTYSASYALTQADVDAGSFSNSASVSSTEGVTDISGATNTDDDPTVVTYATELVVAVIKTGTFVDESGDGFAQVGETIDYTFAIGNLGGVTLTNIALDDSTTGVVASGSPIASLAPGSGINYDYTATYTITQADVDAGQFTNSATITSDQGATDISGTAPFNDTPTVTTILGEAKVALTKTGTFADESGDGFAQAGETITYTFDVENTGSLTLNNVDVADTVGGVVVSGTAITSLAPGVTDNTTFTGSYTITQTDVDNGGFDNTASVATDEGASDNDRIFTNLPSDSQVALIKTGTFADGDGDGFAEVGETIDYTFTVENTGSTTLTNVAVSDATTGVTVTGSAIASLAPGAIDTATYTATHTLTQADVDAGQFTNSATVSTNQGVNDVSGATNADNDPTIVTYTTNPEVAVIKSGSFVDGNGDGFAQVGETINYFFTVSNVGDVTLTNVAVSDATTGVIVSGSAIASLGPGNADFAAYTATYTLTQADIDAGQFTNSATVTTDEGATDTSGPSFTDDDPTVVTLTTNHEVTLTKTGTFNDQNGDSFAQPGETINYVFEVENVGDVTLTGIDVTDTVSGVALTGTTIASLAPGAVDSTTFAASYAITQADIDLGQFTNNANVTTSQTASDDVDELTILAGESKIALIKSGTFADESGDGFAQAGETINYAFTVENTGDVTLTNLTVSDATTGVVMSGSPIALFVPGAINGSTFTATHTLTQADVDLGQFTNSASVSTAEGATDVSGASNVDNDPTIVSYPATAEVALVKAGTFADESGDGFAQAGETINYTFTVENTGDLTITNATVTDASTGVVVSGSPIASLAPGVADSATYTGSYTLTQIDIDTAQFTNSATVATDQGVSDTSGATNTDDDPTVVPLTTNPEVTLTKTGTLVDESGDGFAQAGETINYAFTVDNTGDVTLSSVTVADPTSGVTVFGAPIGALSPGVADSSTYTAAYTVTQADVDAGQFVNTANVTSSEGATDDDTETTTLPGDFTIALIKAGTFADENGDGFAQAGETIDYAFTLENIGGVTLTNVAVADATTGVVVSGSPIVSLAPAATDSTTYSASYTLTQADVDAAEFTNSATVSTDEPAADTSGATNTDDDPTVVPLTTNATVAIVKTGTFVDSSGDGFAQPGEIINYSFTVENTGGVTLNNVTVADATTGVSISGSPIASLAPGAIDSSTYTASHTLTQSDIDAGQFTNSATVSSDEGATDTSGATNTDDDPTVVPLTTNAEVTLTKTGTFVDTSGDGFAQPGETITYTFEIENVGDVTLTNVNVADTVGGVVMSGAAIASLAPGAIDTATFTASYVITQADVDATQFDNTATVSSVEGAVADGTESIPLPGDVSGALIKAGTFADENGDGFAQVGETINYSFTVENTGGVSLTNAIVSDTTTGVIVSGSPIASIGPAAANISVYTATYALTQADLDAGEFTNSASLTTDEGATDISGVTNADDDPTVVPLVTNDAVALIKTATFADESGDGFAQAGETIDYAFRIENVGDASLSNVTVADATTGVVVSGSPIATLGTAAVDSSSYTASYVLTQADIDAAEFTNSATVSTDEGVGDISGATNTDDDVTVVPLTTTNSITLVKAGTFNDENGDGSAQEGETITYTFTIENTGDVTLNNVILDDATAGVVVSGSLIPVLAPGAVDSSTYTATYVVNQDDVDVAQFTNQANVVAVEGATDLSGVTSADDDPTVVPLTATADVAIVKAGTFADESGDGFAQVGETIDYVFTVENTGGLTLNNTTVSDVTTGVVVSGAPIATLFPGAIDNTTYSASYILTQADIDAAQFTNSATVATDEGAADTSGATNTDDDPTVVPLTTNPEVKLVKAGTFADENADGVAQAGETIDYTFTVENTGDVTLTTVAVTDATTGVVLSGAPITSLAAGAVNASTYSASHVLTQADIDAAEFTNSATVATNEGAADTSGATNADDDPTVIPLITVAEVAVVKTGAFADNNGDGFAQVGETILYSFTLENTGDTTITDVTVTDATGGVVVSGSPVPSIAPGSANLSTYTASYLLTQADIDAGQFTNTANASTTEGATDLSGATSGDDDPTVIPLTTNPEVSLVKTGTFTDANGDGFAQAGEAINYAFEVENIGDVTLTSVAVGDTVGGVTVFGAPILSLAPGAVDSSTFVANYVITQADVDAGMFDNTATVTTAEAATADGAESTLLPGDFEISIVKEGAFADESGDGFAQAGETIDYTFLIENLGSTTLTNVTVTDPTTGVALAGAPVATMAPGTSDASSYSASYVLTQADIDAAEFTNQASVATDEGASDTSGATKLDDDPTVVPLTTVSDVALVKTGTFADGNGDGFAQAGETIDYTFEIENTGGVTLNNVTVVDATTGVVLSGSAIASLAPAAIDTSSYTASHVLTQADIDAAEFTNSATVSSDEGAADTSGATNGDDDPTVVPLLTTNSVTLIKTGTFIDDNGDSSAQPGETINYTFTIENTGGVTLNNVTITDATTGVILSGSPIASLAPGAVDSSSYTASYLVTQADVDVAQFTNSATVATDEGAADTSGATDLDDDPTVVPLTATPNVALVKTGTFADENGDGFAQAGETIDYVFAVENTGGVTLNNTVVSDATVGVNLSGSPITSLVPGAIDDSSYTAIHVLTQADVDAAEFVNTASVTTDEGVGDTSGTTNLDDDPTVVPLITSAEVKLVKTGTFADENGDGNAQAGETITYVFTLENTAGVTLNNVTVIDATAGVILSGTPIASLAPGVVDSSSFTASHIVTQADIDAAEFTNSATVATDEGAVDTSGATNGDDDPTVVPLTATAEVALVKTGTFADDNGDGFAQAGETIDYTFTIENIGGVTLNNTIVTDVTAGVIVSGSPIASLAPTDVDSSSYTASYVLTQADVDAAEFTNSATVATDEGAADTSGATNLDDDPTIVPLITSAEVTLVKAGTFADQNGDGFAQAGETINYAFEVENIGGVTLNNVDVADTVGGVTVSGSPIVSLAPGVVDDSTVTATYVVTQADVDTGVFDNTATVTTDEGATADGLESTVLPGDSSVSLIKAGTFADENADGSAQAGETIDYVFTIDNVGSTTLANVTVSDPTTGVILSGSPIATMAPGVVDPSTYSASYTITQADIDTGEFTNQASVATDQGAADTSGATNLDDDPTVVPLTATPEVALVKTGTFADESGDGFAQAGETINYTFVIENIGGVTLNNTIVSDLTSGVVVSGSPIASLAPTDVDTSSYTASYVLTQADVDAAEFTNSATVATDEGAADTSGATNLDDDPTVVPLLTTNEVVLVKTGTFADDNADGFAQAGETINYTFTIENTGGVTLNNVTVADVTTGVVVSGSSIASLAPGVIDSSSYAASYVVTQADVDAAEFTNSATVSSDEGAADTSGATNLDDDPTIVPLLANPEIALVKTGTFADENGDGFAQAGESINYAFAIENIGGVTLSNVVVSDLTTGVIVSGTPIPSLAPGLAANSAYTASYVLTQADVDAAEFVNTASVATDEGAVDTSGATNTDDDPTVVPLLANTEVALVKAGTFADESGDGFAQVGETINYTFSIENLGGVTLNNVSVSDVTSGVIVSGAPVTSLAPGAVDSSSYSASYIVTQADIDAGQFTNSATVANDEGAVDTSGATNGDDDATVVPLLANTEVALVKAASFADESGDGFAQAGETIDYTFTIENIGGVTLNNVIVTDATSGVVVSGSPIGSLAPAAVDASSYTASYVLTQPTLTPANSQTLQALLLMRAPLILLAPQTVTMTPRLFRL